MDSYLKLSIAALLPVVLSCVLLFLCKKTAFGKINGKIRQVIIGILFGALAIVGTEWGIPFSGAQANCRDAAVLTAGLLFGGPAGIIAGFIGGLERWFAVYWGIGAFTRIACTVSTVIAGFYAAVLRKYMFENKPPSWLLALAIGVVMEIFHLTMVFITNMSTPIEALSVVKACTLPMVTANGVSVMLTTVAAYLLGNERGREQQNKVRISQTVQRWLLLTVVLAFLFTSLFVFSLQNAIADAQTDTLLNHATMELSADISEASDKNLLSLTKKIAAEVKNGKSLTDVMRQFDVAEVSMIDNRGFITDSTEVRFIGYDMASGEQSAEFMCLLSDAREFVQQYQQIAYDDVTMRKYAGVRYGDGFIQVGYDATRFYQDVDHQVLGISKNRHVGNTGYILVLDRDLKVVSAPVDFPLNMFDGVEAKDVFPEENTTFSIKVNGEPCFSRYCTVEGYYVVSVLPEEEAMQMRNIAIYVNTFMEILVFAILFALIYLLIKKVVVNRITDINTSLTKITGGDLDEVVDVRSNEEFASLSDDINSTVSTLKRYIDEASARIDKELEFAKSIQSSALPNVFPAFPKRKDFDIYAVMDPAKEVGGDFYDFYITHDDTLNFLIADVSGKGIPAAMFMMRAKTELKSLTEADLPLNEVFTRGNAALCEGNDAGMFVTAWQGSVDLTTGMVRFANAGHNPPMVRHANGTFEYLKVRAGFVLAGFDSIKFKINELQLQPGDIIFLYTDGVTEATNADEQLYGEDRLLAAANSVQFTDMKSLCDLIKQDVDAFVGEAPQFDDITMVAFRYVGTPEVPSIYFEEAKLEDISAATEFVETELEKLDCPMKTVIQMNVAVDEIFSNIVRYGYPKGPGPVKLELIHREDPEAICLRFTDEGIPYNPLKKEDPDITLSAEDRSIGGLGIFMVKKTMDDMRYAYENDRNILTIKKLL